MKNPYCQSKELSCFHQVLVSMTIWIHHDHYPMVKCSVLISHEAPLDVVLTQVASPAPQELMQCIDSVLALCCFVLITKGNHHLANCRGMLNISWTSAGHQLDPPPWHGRTRPGFLQRVALASGSRIEQLEELLPSLQLECGSL